MILVQNGDHFTTSKSAIFTTDSGIHVFGSFDFDCAEHVTLEMNYDGTVVYEDGASGHLVSTFTGI